MLLRTAPVTKGQFINRQVPGVETQQVFHRMKKLFVFGKKYFYGGKQTGVAIDRRLRHKLT